MPQAESMHWGHSQGGECLGGEIADKRSPTDIVVRAFLS